MFSRTGRSARSRSLGSPVPAPAPSVVSDDCTAGCVASSAGLTVMGSSALPVLADCVGELEQRGDLGLLDLHHCLLLGWCLGALLHQAIDILERSLDPRRQ